MATAHDRAILPALAGGRMDQPVRLLPSTEMKLLCLANRCRTLKEENEGGIGIQSDCPQAIGKTDE